MSKTHLIKASEVERGNVLIIDDEEWTVQEANVELLTAFIVMSSPRCPPETVPVNSIAWLVVKRDSLTPSQRKKLHGTS